MTLDRDALEALPKTARDAIGPHEWLLPVTATCVTAEPVDVNLAGTAEHLVVTGGVVFQAA
jgi:hypothetical protein